MSGIDIYNYSARLRRQRTRVIKEYGERALLFPGPSQPNPGRHRKSLALTMTRCPLVSDSG